MIESRTTKKAGYGSILAVRTFVTTLHPHLHHHPSSAESSLFVIPIESNSFVSLPFIID
jgi:hypothetical protein